MKHQKVEGTKMKTFNFLRKLGEGAWAIVYEAFDQNTQTNVAVKAIPRILMKQTPKLDELVKTQIRVLRECHNENVIRFVDSFASDKTQFIAMEYCDGGDLQNYLDKKKRLTEDEATTFLKQILNGFRGLHEVNAMHRDFKVANVLIHQGMCKIADLGFAKQMENDGKKKMTGTILGTSLTMAPELLREQKYGMQADIWSVGVVYYQLLYGKYPFMGMSDLDILKKIETTKPDFTGVNISVNARSFIERCLTDNRQLRISWREIYDHPLIKSQEKMMYGLVGLVSRLNIKQNKEFYKKDIKINDDYIYAQKKQIKKKESFQEAIVQTQHVNMDKLRKQDEEKKKIAQAIEKYEKIYLNKRNNIMFIFKFVTPYIYNLYAIKANHGINLFILSKKAYHDMKSYVTLMKNKTDFLKVGPYFNDFVKSKKYQAILEVVCSDLDCIMAQVCSYREDIEYCSSEIKKEYDIEQIFSQNWPKLIQDTIDSYEFQLGEAIDQMTGEQKKDLIKVIEALLYYKNNADADVENFDRKIETLDYKFAEVSLRSRFQAIFK